MPSPITSLKSLMIFCTTTGSWISFFLLSFGRIRCRLFDLTHLYRREMMPLLSLIFSALFILFGTVVIQAFRSENKHYSCIKSVLFFFAN